MEMEIIEYYASEDQEHWLKEIKRSDWGAGRFLYELLRDNRLKELCGDSTKVLMLTDGGALVSFCTYAQQDDIQETSLTPWVGFVYTFPEYRGKCHVGKLLERAYALAKYDGYEHIYISTGETGLYEKYGYVFWKIMKDMHGEDSRVYRINVETGNCKRQIIAACGNDCAACPRFICQPYEKTQEDLKNTAELWFKIGYRDRVVSTDEISCLGCKPENWCRYHVVSCCMDKGIENCSDCTEYPCDNMKKCFEITKSFEPMCRKVCSEDEYLQMKKAFFEKEENLRKEDRADEDSKNTNG